MTTITDTFTRADSTTTLGSTESPVLAWTVRQGTWGVNTNRAYSVTNADGDTVTVSVGQADMAVAAKIIGPGAGRLPAVVARYVDLNNSYRAESRADLGTVALFRRIGGSDTQITTMTFADGDVVGLSTVEESGSTRVILYKNSVQQYSTLDSTAGRPAGTHAGLRWAGAISGAYFDDFTVDYTPPPAPSPEPSPAEHVRVEVAFTTSPDDPAPAFTDLTSRLDRAAGIGITRGRQDEYGAVQPGRCSLTLDNTDGALTAGKASSSFYPYVKPSRRMRVTYRNPTTAGNLLTANQASIETSSNDYATTSAFGFIGGATKVRSSTHALDGTWSLHVTWPTTGAGNTAIMFTPVSGLVAGRQYILSLSVWVPTGSPGVKADVLLTNASAVSTVFDAWQRLSVVFTAVNETHQVGVSVVNSTAGNDVWVDAVMLDEGSTLRAFTTTAPAIEYRYDGYVEEWPTEWPGGNKYTQATITAVDLLARLGTKRKLRSVVEETVLLANPVAYYTLGEPEDSLYAGDVAARGGMPLSIVQIGAGGGTLTFGTGTGPGTDGLPAPMFAPSSTTSGWRLGSELFMVGGDEPGNSVGWIYDVGVRASIASSYSGAVTSIIQLLDPFGFYLALRMNATGKFVVQYWDPWDGSYRVSITSANSYNDGQTHNPGVTMTQSGGTVTVTLWDGSDNLGSGTFSVAQLPKFTRLYVGGGRQDEAFTGTLSHVAVFNTVTSAQLGAMSIAAANGFAGERSDERIARIASWVGLPTVRQILDTGQSTSIAHVDPTGKKPLDYMQQIADTEGGVLFADRQGRLVFYSRARAYTAQSVTASVDAHDVAQDTSPRESKQELVNDVTGKRTDGGPEIRILDLASAVEHGYYEESRDLAVTTDNEVLAALQWLIGQHSQPRVRVPDVAIDAMTNTAIQAQVRAIDVWSRVQVTATPTQAHASTWDLLAQGYTESISLSGWQVTVNATAYDQIQALRYDDPASQYDSTFSYVY